jgi:RNA polymerase sigma factor (TIGR02999 family)
LFFLFGRAMRDVLVEHARANRAARRGGGRTILSIDGDACEAPAEGVDILELHEALDTLANHDPGAARVVVLRFFGGRTLRDIVELEERSLDAVRRDWEYARAWLQARMGTP